jgi:hypothetical protein
MTRRVIGLLVAAWLMFGLCLVDLDNGQGLIGSLLVGAAVTYALHVEDTRNRRTPVRRAHDDARSGSYHHRSAA